MSKASPKKTRKRSRAQGTVGILVLLFVVSAGLRLGSSATQAYAQVENSSSQTPPPSAPSEISRVTTSEELEPLLRAFERREERIKVQEAQIEQRLAALNTAEEQITDKLSQLKEAEKELRATIALANSAAEDDLSQLTVVYENMKPKTAAALFEEMAPEFAAGFLGRMRPDIAASIMAGMTPESAYTVSTILAGRNANVPTE